MHEKRPTDMKRDLSKRPEKETHKRSEYQIRQGTLKWTHIHLKKKEKETHKRSEYQIRQGTPQQTHT